MSARDFSVAQSSIRTAEFANLDHQLVLLSVLGAISSNDMHDLPNRFTENVEMRIHGYPPMNGKWRGREAVIGAIASNFAQLAEQKPEIEGIVQQGDSVVMRLRESGTIRSDGRSYRSRAVLWFTFSGEQIQSVEEFVDLSVQDTESVSAN